MSCKCGELQLGLRSWTAVMLGQTRRRDNTRKDEMPLVSAQVLAAYPTTVAESVQQRGRLPCRRPCSGT